ncbi:MAG: Calx-beta domain-containing protein [Bacteroidota bacterium]
MRKLISLTPFSLFLTRSCTKVTQRFLLFLGLLAITSTTLRASNLAFMPPDTISIRDTFLVEGNDPTDADTLYFILERSDDMSTFSVAYNTCDSTAFGADMDFQHVIGTRYFTANSGILVDTIKVPVLPDRKTERDEIMKVFLYNLNEVSGMTVFGDSIGYGTIINNDTSYLSIRDTCITEGNTGTDSLRFAVDLTGELDTMFSFFFITMDSQAMVSTSDYAIQSGNRTGSGTGAGSVFWGIDTVSVGINGDLKVEKEELLKVMLSNLDGNGRPLLFLSNDSLGMGAIKNDDTTYIAIRDTLVMEGDSGTDTLKFVVSVGQPVDSLAIVYTTFDSTALGSDGDFVAKMDTLRMDCTLVDTIKIAVNGDEKVELDESIQLYLTEILPGDRSVSFQKNIASGTIVNDDTARVTIRDTLVTEGNSGTSQLEFVVSTDFEVDTMCLVYMTFDSTALLTDNDYVMRSDTLWTSGFGDTIRVTVNGDNTVEKDEQLVIAIKEILPSNRAIFFADSLALGAITNDDTAFVTINDTLIMEGDMGIDSLCFVVNISSPVDTAFGYTYQTAGSSAMVADNDYIAESASLNFTNPTDTICIVVNGDSKVELDEQFKVLLDNITVGNRPVFFADSLGVGTIQNDDTARITITDVTLNEGDVGNTAFNFTVRLDGDLGNALSVDYATCDSTATVADADYLAASGTLNFAGTAGETQNITVNVVGNGLVEIDEVFSVKLSNLSASGLNVLLSSSIGIGQILNDDFDPTISDPCSCLNNASSAGSKDGQFAETVNVTSQTGERWYIASVTGLYRIPFTAFPPLSGGNPYPLTPFVTGASGQQLTETDLGNGLSAYTLHGIHVDDIGYTITVTNGTDVRTIGNTCHYEKACSADQTFVMPFFPNTDGEATIRDCAGNNQFINDWIHLYRDTAARYNEMTICPNIRGQVMTVTFESFDLAAGDTLWVYDGVDTTFSLIAKGSGNSVSNFNGGWVNSNCDPNINPSGCLTFVFTTNGDNNKGAGWEAKVSCELMGTTTLNPVNDIYARAKCDSSKTPVNLRVPTINRSSSDCALSDNRVIVTYCDFRDTLTAGQLDFPVFPFGIYDIQYKLLVDTTITTSNRVIVTTPPLVCNDTVQTAIGQGCVTMLTPDDILEFPCDTVNSSVNQMYSIRVLTDSGYVVGSAPNYPLLKAGKGGNVTCNQYYEVTVFRTLQVNHNGCMRSTIDSCTSRVQLTDGIKPAFVNIRTDTVFGCYTTTLTADMLPRPTVIDNCDLDTLIATVQPTSAGGCERFKTVQVTWTAVDLCGNSSQANQTVVIQRPERMEIPRDTILNCGSSTHPDSIGWPKIDVNGDNIGDQEITVLRDYCNFGLLYEDRMIPGSCGQSANILRVFTLFDDCANVKEPIFVDTQFIELRDTVAPIVNCPAPNVIGSVTNPYQFKTAYNTCTGLPETIAPPTGMDACDPLLAPIITGIFEANSTVKVGNNLAFLNPLPIGKYRVAYRLRDDCGNLSEVCNIYFDIIDTTIPTAICSDELVVSLAFGNLEITPEDISDGSFDACGIDTMLIRRTLCGSTTDYPAPINAFVANKWGTNLEANGWSSSIEIGCCDVNTPIKVQLLIFDKSGNHNKCWLTISPENQPQSVCGDLPNVEGSCDNYDTNFIGQSTDTNGNRAFDADEWQPVDPELVTTLNTQFGNPACNTASTVCTNGSIEQEYQLLREGCGMQMMRRRFRTVNTGGTDYPWYYQNITIEYQPGWALTLPADTTLPCGMTDVANIPEMALSVANSTCDQIAWEVEDEVFETEDGACYKILRNWYVINACLHGNVQAPFTLPRDQFAGKVTVNSDRTFTSNDTIFGTELRTKGYFKYTQIIVVTDNEAPVITIADVDTCIVGVGDAAPFGQADVTPGTAPYECDTLRTFSATGTDCVASNLLDFSYEVFVGNTRINFGEGSTFTQVVQSNIDYIIRFNASDNCGNIGAAERTFRFADCRAPTPVCQDVTMNISTAGTITLNASMLNLYSYDNCTDSSDLDFRIWNTSLNVPMPTNLLEVQALPSTIVFDCGSFGNTTANLYVIDEAGQYDFCTVDVFMTDNSNVCQFNRPFITGSIQNLSGEMVNEVAVELTGNAVEMPKIITTDDSGTFKYMVEEGASYMLKPKKNTNPLNGVSTFDLVLMQKHILGLKTFDSPYHYIAADVNQSGTVSAYDMVITRQLILNIISEFPNNESWQFVNMMEPMSNDNPLIGGYQDYYDVLGIDRSVVVDFMAVKIGDVNGNARPNSLVRSEPRSFNGSVHIEVEDRFVQTGESYSVNFTVANASEIQGYQFTLVHKGLSFEQWESGSIGEAFFGYADAKRGLLTTSWNRLAPTSTESTTDNFVLKFTAERDGYLSEFLTITSDLTAAEGYHQSNELLAIQLDFKELPLGQKAFELFQNRPNPFQENTTIQFNLPEASATTLTLMDVTGKVLKTINGYHDQGINTIQINRADLPTSGLIYYQLTSSAGKMTKTMLVLD